MKPTNPRMGLQLSIDALQNALFLLDVLPKEQVIRLIERAVIDSKTTINLLWPHDDPFACLICGGPSHPLSGSIESGQVGLRCEAHRDE